MTHRPDRIAEVLDLGRAGFSATEIGRRLGTPRETVRDWLAGVLPRSARHGEGGCERCGGVAHAYAELPATYVYLLGLHSDGCRFMNTGTNRRNPRYSFSNRSRDIRGIFCDACARLGLRWTTSPHTVYVSRKADVARLDEFIGPKT